LPATSEADMNDSFYKIIVEQSFQGVAVFDKKTLKCLYTNKMAQEILELESDDFSVSDLFPGDQREGHRNFNTDHIELTGVFADLTVRKHNGGVLVGNVGVKPLGDTMFVLMLQDVTFQKKLQREVMTKQSEIIRVVDELQQQNKQLRELDKAKTRFLALTSHELRTPLSSIVATAQFIDDGLCDNEGEVLTNVKVILEEGRHLLEIINDILDFSKIQAGKVDLFVERLDPVKLLKYRLEHITKFADTRGITITTSHFEDGNQAYFDSLRLTQVFDNVLSNAVKYNVEKGKVTVSFDFNKSESHVTVSFADTGPGIPEESHDKVFNEFETIENIRNHQKGTGLGMPICRKLMDLMGGKIYFTSEVGKGTTFFVEIPTQKVLDPGCYKSRADSLNPKAS
jgi:signal transduction histidine kinase